MPVRPTGITTFLFTDIEGSTKLWEQHPDAMQAALDCHNAILTQAIEGHHGYVFKMVGDAFCAAFPTAIGAVGAAIEAQRGLRDTVWGKTGPLRIRAGLHTASVEERGGDYFGPSVNRVARLMSAGHGGQVLLSQATYDLVCDALPDGVDLRDLGVHRLKDLARPEHIFQLVAPNLPADFPPLKTLDNRPNNLPAQPTPLIGRQAEVATIRHLLFQPDLRLVTLIGPGGTGKTRLGLQVAVELVDEFDNGVYFVPLASITDPALVATTIAETLDIRQAGSQPLLTNLTDALRDKHMLLVLDNFEHVMASAPLVAGLLRTCPRLKVLVTSRVRLHLRGEQEFPVSPLTLPDLKRLPSVEALSQYSAVELFIQRAVNTKPDFQLTNENASAVAEICYRLDGLPLAIELAAARIKLFPPQALLTRLDRRLRMLTGGPRDVPLRQQTLRNTIAWSYDLLDETEKALFRGLAVFVGGCTLEAVEAVCSGAMLNLDVLEGVASLVDKSLLRCVEQPNSETRFLMLETIREYALEQLEASEAGEAEAIRRQHAAFFLGLAEEAKPQLRGAEQREWLERLESEHDNLRFALAQAKAMPDGGETSLRLTCALWRFWWVRGYIDEGREWLEEALARASEPTVLRADALRAAGIFAGSKADYPAAQSRLEDSVALSRRVGNKRAVAAALTSLAVATYHQGDFNTARPLLEESLTIKRDLGDKPGQAVSLNNLGEVARHQGDYASARALLEESLALHRELGDTGGVAMSVLNLGTLSLSQGNYASARPLLEESLAIFRAMGDKEGIAECLERLAQLTYAQAHLTDAGRLLGATETLREATGAPLASVDRSEHDRIVAGLRAGLSEAMFAGVWAEGRAMTLEQAVAYAFQAGRPPLSDTQQRGAEFHIEIDEAKKQRQVTEVVTSTAFQALQEKARRFRSAQV